MYDIVNCEAKNEHGFTELILFSKVKNKIKEITEDKDILRNLNFRGLFLLKKFRVSTEMIKLVGEKKSGFLIDLSILYKSKGPKRGIVISQLRDLVKFCIKYNAGYYFGSFADKEEEIRTPEEIVGIGNLIGLNEEQINFSLKELNLRL